MKKLLLMVPMLHQGGFEKVCVRTARLLADDCEVSILIFSDEDIAYEISGLHIIHLNIKSRNSRIQKIVNLYKRVRAVRNIKKSVRPDITYSFGITANLVNVFAKGHGAVWIGIRGFTDLYSKSYPVLCRMAGKIVCCSKTIEEVVRQTYPQKDIITIYNSYNIVKIKQQAQEQLTPDEEEFFAGHDVIVSMGREDEVKGFWHLIRSFSLIHRENPNTRLMIIGEGAYEENKQFAGQLGIADQVFFTGLKKNPFPYLKRSAVYALTSLHEGFPNALVEAMALSVPAVAVNCQSGPAEILSKNPAGVADDTKTYYAEYGVLVPRLSEVKNLDITVVEPGEKILAEIILRILTDKSLREQYKQAACRRAEEFSDAEYVDTLLKQIKAVKHVTEQI